MSCVKLGEKEPSFGVGEQVKLLLLSELFSARGGCWDKEFEYNQAEKQKRSCYKVSSLYVTKAGSLGLHNMP